jgi:CRP/FNR family transcriptional regulator, anaerobic regulatory protein
MFDQRERQSLRPALREPLGRGERRLAVAFAAPPRTAEAHAVLADPKQPGRELLRLGSGWACRSRALSGGRRAVLAIYLPGDFIGLDAAFSDRTADRVTALTQVVYHAVAAHRLIDLLDEPEVVLRLWHARERELRRVEALAAKLARISAEERVAGFLLHLHERLLRRQLVTGSSFRLPLTQQEVGDHLGLTVVHVNRVLRSLREQGIVEVRRHVATIADLERLTRAAAGDASKSTERKAPAQPASPPLSRSRLAEDAPSAQVAAAMLGIRAPAGSSTSRPGSERRG